MQAVILTGGLGTRLGSLTRRVPKGMLECAGRPFLAHQLDLLRRSRICDIVLCIGRLGGQVVRHFGDGAAFGLRVRYSWERRSLLGTGGALRHALPLLQDRFLVMYGDSYLPIDYGQVGERFATCDRLGLMVVYENRGRYDWSNLRVEDDLVVLYDTGRQIPGLMHIDYGLSGLRREALALLPERTPCSLAELFQVLVARRELAAWETHQRFYEIGSPAGLAEFRRLAEAGELAS